MGRAATVECARQKRHEAFFIRIVRVPQQAPGRLNHGLEINDREELL